ncbi:MAG TPA: response regulator [Euzebya sp.]|nr:response regulator [Euzebya sp.]
MRFLIVDDEPDLRLILQVNLQRWGHDVVLAASAAEAWAHIQESPPQAMLLDVSMPGETGLHLLQRLRAADRLPPQVALLSAMLPADLSRQAGQDGLHRLSKPFGLAELEALITRMAAAG